MSTQWMYYAHKFSTYWEYLKSDEPSYPEWFANVTNSILCFIYIDQFQKLTFDLDTEHGFFTPLSLYADLNVQCGLRFLDAIKKAMPMNGIKWRFNLF